MPKTKSSKKDNRTPLEKLTPYENKKTDLFIFYQYYDGIESNGLHGFAITKKNPVGSVKHQRGSICERVMTSSQFRSKSQTLVTIAREFVEKKESPPDSFRVTFTLQDYEKLQAEIDKKKNIDPMSVLDKVNDEKAKFVFFQYYDGITTIGEIGFSLRAGGYGSIAHMRVFPTYFSSRGDSWFRRVGKHMGQLAREFVDSGLVPPDHLRPPMPQPLLPQDMIDAANQTIYGNGNGFY